VRAGLSHLRVTMEGMNGKRQHYLPAVLVGGFGERREGKELRSAKIVARRFALEGVLHGTAEHFAFQNGTYRFDNAPPGVDPDAVDNLWGNIEGELPGLVYRLSSRALAPDDDEKLPYYAATALIRHPDLFRRVATEYQRKNGHPTPSKDDALMQVRKLVDSFYCEMLSQWIFRTFHSPLGAPRFVISDRGWSKVYEPRDATYCYWFPMGPRVGVLAYRPTRSTSSGAPASRPPFGEHRTLEVSWVEFFNATAWSDRTITDAVFAHPCQEQLLAELPPIRGVDFQPFRGMHSEVTSLLD